MIAPPTTPSKPISEIDRQILAPGDVDSLGEMLLSLARELWVLTDRMAVMEQVLGEAGIDVAARIDAYQPTELFSASLALRRKRLIDEMLRAMGTAIPAGVTHSSKFGD